MTALIRDNIAAVTCPPVPVLTRHAHSRMQQRHFSQVELNYVIDYGRLFRRTGICFYFLGAKDIPLCDRKLAWVQRLVGLTVLASADEAAVITLYKNQKSLRDIKKKSKFRS
jgi:hypothetical protein